MAATVDPARKLQIFINGALVKSGGTYEAITAGKGYMVNIGRMNLSGGTYYFFGQIDDVRVYASSLSLSEIQRHYADGLPKYQLAKIDSCFIASGDL